MASLLARTSRGAYRTCKQSSRALATISDNWAREGNLKHKKTRVLDWRTTVAPGKEPRVLITGLYVLW